MSITNINRLLVLVGEIEDVYSGDTRREWSIQDDCRDVRTEAERLLKRKPEVLHDGPYLKMFYLNMDKLLRRVQYYNIPYWFKDIMKEVNKK